MATCAKCKQAPNAMRLHKCVVCFKPICDRCAVRRYGQMFCSEACAKVFFFPDEVE